MKPVKLLILGGSGEAAGFARALDGDARFEVTLSLAGRTAEPIALPGSLHRGGFGGAGGLARYLAAERVDCVIDATHPFAVQMKANAVEAAREAGVSLLAIRRPPWAPSNGDNWIIVDNIEDAAAALGPAPRRVFLTTGRMELAPFRAAPQHFYVLRSVEAPSPAGLPPRVSLITARGPFKLADEMALLEDNAIEIIVTKNSGGEATRAKLDAARALGLPVIMVRRPEMPEAPSVETVSVETVAEALAWLEARYRGHDSTSSA